ncbi:hypothetical protein [Priestia flexa]|uniref:Uncharacterized protein n=1 Tax=Priestia flexa TaxID=86664 RepID=A0A8I1SP93_9BACI|nr:hypothetical protein [Priestia flexa]MBN8253264.1 hypothetical protein [Priestia flexa]
MENRNAKQNVFNIYYINFSKVYEISMMINNVILSTIQKEKTNSKEKSKSINASANSSISTALSNLADIKAVVGGQLAEKKTSSSKMVESLDVKTTKSILLKQIDKRCALIKNFNNCREGDLVKLNNVHLKVLNEENLREFKLLRGDALKGVNIDGVDVNNLIGSMLKDYSYLLYGTLPNSKEEIVIKIPMELENEFESKYSIDDLLIGNVSIIGVYKGGVEEEFVNKNTFTHLYNIGTQQPKEEEKVFSSSYEQNEEVAKPLEYKNRKFKFIDIIAIIQNVNFAEEPSISKEKISWIKRLVNKIKGKDIIHE